MKSKELSLKYGEKIKRLRQNLNLTQEDFAKKINTTQKNITRWESGESLISTYFLYEICKVFNINMSYWDITEKKIEHISRVEFNQLCQRISSIENYLSNSSFIENRT